MSEQKDSSETAVEINFHKFVGTGAGELSMTPCERCGALERDLIHVDKFRETAVAGVPSVHIDDYRNAPSGVGPLASTWKDKPHRLLYDLCKELERARACSPSVGNDKTLHPFDAGRVDTGICQHRVNSEICGQRWDAAIHKPTPVTVDEAARRIAEKIAKFDNDDEKTCGGCRSWYCAHWKASVAEIIATEMKGEK